MIFGIVLTLHMAMEGNYNQFHPIVSQKFNHGTVGIFLNSMDNVSVFASRQLEWKQIELEYGLVSGYDDIAPVVPFGRLKYKDYFLAPGIENGGLKGFVIGKQFNF